MVPESLWSSVKSFVATNPTLQSVYTWAMEKPMLAQSLEWAGWVAEKPWGFMVFIVGFGILMRLLSPVVLIARLVWVTLYRLCFALFVQLVIHPINSVTAYLNRPRAPRPVQSRRPGDDVPAARISQEQSRH